MSNEFKVGFKLHVDSVQYTTEFTKAGQTAQAFAAQVSGSATNAATGVQAISGKLGELSQAASSGNTAAAAIDRITQSGRQAAGVIGAAADTASQKAAVVGTVAQAALGQTTISARQTEAALRGVPAQFTDIVTSIQAGQSPLTVFLQQGGQLKDMFGGAIPAAKALTGYVLGLVNPFTAAAAAGAVLGLAYYQGSQEADGFRAAVLMSGNAAGTTVGQLTDMARAIAEVTGTQGSASAALTQMAASGAVARENLQQFSQTAIGLEKYVGQPVKNTVADLEQLGKAPLQASVKLNEQYRYLTASVYEQIRALEEQGRKEEAGAVAQKAYAAAMEARKNEIVANLGSIERGWNAVTGAAKKGWDAILNIGREQTGQQKLDAVSARIATLRKEIGDGGFASTEGGAATGGRNSGFESKRQRELDALLATQAALQENARLEQRGAEAAAARANEGAAAAEWGKIVTANKTKERQQEEEITRIRNAGKAARKDEVEIEREITAYKARVADKGAAGAATRELEQQRSLLAELAGLSSDFYKDWEGLNKQFKDGKLTAEQLTQEQEKLLAKQPAIKKAREDEIKLLQAQYVEQQRIAEEVTQAELARDRAAASGRTAVAEYSRQVDEATRYLEVERSTVSGTASQRALAVDLLRIQIDLEKQLAAIDANQGFNQSDRDEQKAKAISTAAQARANATARAEIGHARELGEELKRVTEQYEQGLTNAAIQGGKSLREYIQGMLRATAFRIILDPIMRPLAGVLASVTGSGSTASAAAGNGGVTGIANTLSSAYSALTNGVSRSIAAGFAKLAGSSFGQSLGLSNSAAIAGNNPSAYVPPGGQLTSLGQTIGTGLGMLGNGFAGYGISSAISNGYTTGGKTVNVLSGIASAFLGPIAGLGGGLINRAFGRKLKDTGVEGTLGGSAGFEGNTYQFYKGGWFRSNKTVRGELDQEVERQIAETFKATQVQVGLFATALGLQTDRIAGFTTALKLSTNGLDEAGIQQAFQDALVKGSNELAQQVLGTWTSVSEQLSRTIQSTYTASEYAKAGEEAIDTLTRLATSLTLANAAFDNFGVKLYESSLAGANIASKLMDASGGTDAFTSNAAAYYDAFFTDAEKTANTQRNIASTLGSVGLQLPATREGFRALVDEQIALGEAGVPAVAALLKVSAAFASIVPAVEAVDETFKAATETIEDYVNRTARTALEADRIKGLAAVGNTEALTRLGVPAYLHGSHASGLANVPFDGYRAELHKGERVLTAQDNGIFNNLLSGSGRSQGSPRLESLMERLIQSMGEMRYEVQAAVHQAARTARVVEQMVSPEGDAFLYREAPAV